LDTVFVCIGVDLFYGILIWRRVRNGDLGSCWIVITDVVRDLNIFTPSDASSLIIYLTTPPYLEDRRLAIRRASSVGHSGIETVCGRIVKSRGGVVWSCDQAFEAKSY